MRSLQRHLFSATLLAGASLLPAISAQARDYSNWMADLPDAAFVSTLSLPGAHDTATGEGFNGGLLVANSYAYSAQAQTKSISEIINSGVRVLDFRPAPSGSTLKCYHGVAETKKDFMVAIRELCAWLEAHPTEFFVIHLYQGNNNGNINDKMNELLNEDAVKNHLIQFKADLTVAEMRGKILFLKRDSINWESVYATPMDRWEERDNLTSGWELRGRIYETRPGTTNRYDRRENYLLIQDVAHSNGENMDQKKTYSKQIFDFLSTWCPTTRNNMVWTFNFASAYNDNNTSTAIGYANNAGTMNPYFIECLEGSDGPAGMVMIDFVGADQHNVRKSALSSSTDSKTTNGDKLVKAVIEQNFKYIDSYVARQATEVKFTDHSWAGVLWDNMFYGNNIFADINGNGYMDYVIASSQQESGTAYFATNNGDGGFHFMTERVFGTNYGNHVLAPIDFNNDGKLDFVVLKNNGHCAEIQKNEGNGKFTKIENTGITGTTPVDENNNFDGVIVVLDVNHDGWKDVVTYGEDLYPKVFLGKGDGTFEYKETNMPKLKNGELAIGDYDRDGFADILITGKTNDGDWEFQTGLTLSIVLTRADLNFDIITPESLQPYATYDGGVMFVDMNMDGQLDVFVSGLRNEGNRHDSYISKLFINKGNDVFEEADVLLDPVKKCSADWADLTGNGRPDIVYSGENHLSYYTSTVLNISDDLYKSESTMDGHRASTSVAAFDYRGVGHASVAVMGHSWDSKANQLFDSEITDPALLKSVSSVRDAVTAEAILTELDDSKEEGVIFYVNNADQMPAGTRYNYVMKMKDGSVISNVPVNLQTNTTLIADVNGATTATSIVYPNIKKTDIAAIAIQSIGADKNGSLIDLRSDGITTGIDEIATGADESPAEYYNLQGQRVLNPSNGIYIERRGATSTKKFIR